MHGTRFTTAPLTQMCGVGACTRNYANALKQAIQFQLIVWSFLKKPRLNLWTRSLFFSRQHFFNRCPRSTLKHEIFQVEFCSRAISRSKQAVSSLLNLLI